MARNEYAIAHPAEYKLGHTNEYYTLWHETCSWVDSKGRTVVELGYCCNVSKTLEGAQAKYPGVQFDSSLSHGRKYRKYIESNTDRAAEDNTRFPGGKYNGQLISECEDVDYLIWAIDNNPWVRIDGIGKNLRNRFIELGGKLEWREDGGRSGYIFTTPEEIREANAKEAFLAQFDENPVFTVTTKMFTSLKGYFYYHCDNNIILGISHSQMEPGSTDKNLFAAKIWQGTKYMLPKGKTFKAIEYHIEGGTIYVDKMEQVKGGKK